MRSAISAKMRSCTNSLYILGRGGAQFLIAEPGINLHHLAADFFFADLAGTVGAMAGVNPIAGGAGDQTLLERPGHESIACVSAPEGSIAIEDRDLWIAFQNQPLELLGGPLVNLYLRCGQTFLNPAQNSSNSILFSSKTGWILHVKV